MVIFVFRKEGFHICGGNGMQCHEWNALFHQRSFPIVKVIRTLKGIKEFYIKFLKTRS